MLIEIFSPELAEPEALATALANTTRYSTFGDEVKADIFVSPRKDTGWLEYGIKYTFPQNHGLYVAMIQRTPGAEYEFCS